MKGWTVLGVMALGNLAVAQLRPALYVSAIVGAKVEIRPGVILDSATVVIRDGMIAEVGPNVKAPIGADIVDGKGLFVYAGFIDSWTDKGLRKPEEKPKGYMDPDTSQGAANQMRWGSTLVTPERSAAELYDAASDAWKPFRLAGFTSVLATPPSGIFKGAASLIQTDGRPRRDVIVQSVSGLSSKLSVQGSGTYPGTELGGFATARQALLDAQWYKSTKAYFNAGNGKRPPHDSALEALQPVLAADVPVFFEADGEGQVDRVIDFAHEFGLRPIIVGGREAYRASAKLKRFETPVIAGIDWAKEPMPEPEKPDPKADPKATPPKKAEDKPKEDEEPKAIQLERERLWLEKANNVVALQKAGVSIAFSTSGKSADEFFGNLRRLVKLGLPREAALSGLTITPARILGLDRQVGSVEPGRIANLTILSADFLDPKTKAKWLFIDGMKIDPNANSMKYSNEADDFEGEAL